MFLIGIRHRSFRTGVRRHQGQPCPWCGTPMAKRANRPNSPTRDHLVAKSLMPRGEEGIKVIVCRSCNNAKQAWSLDEWLQLLLQTSDKRAAHVERWIADNPLLMQRARSRLGLFERFDTA